MTRQIIEQGARRLAVPIGAAGRGAVSGRILALKGSTGWLVSAGEVREWRFEAVTQQGDEILLHGPWVSARPLSAAAGLPLAEALPVLSRVARALGQLRDAGTGAFPLQTDAVLLVDDGSGVLFLPPAVVQEIRATRPFAANRETFEAVNHPDASGWRAASFSIAALLYRAVCGSFPFDGNSEEEMHALARSLQVPAPGALVPEVAPDLSSLVMAGLGRDPAGPPDLSRWEQALEGWQRTPPFRAVTGAEKARLLEEAGARRAAGERSFRRREFWRTRWRLVAVIAAAVVAVGIGAGSILSRALAPRPTAGLAPRLVTEAFYRGMGSLDHQLMEACVVDRAGRAEIAEVTGLYVISRVTTAYEGRPGVVSAEEWDRDGRPDLGPSLSVYGVTGLAITQEAGEPQPVFRVDYVKWMPVTPSEDSDPPGGAPPAGPRFAAAERSDRVHLRRDRADWVIFRIERLSDRPVETPR